MTQRHHTLAALKISTRRARCGVCEREPEASSPRSELVCPRCVAQVTLTDVVSQIKLDGELGGLRTQIAAALGSDESAHRQRVARVRMRGLEVAELRDRLESSRAALAAAREAKAAAEQRVLERRRRLRITANALRNAHQLQIKDVCASIERNRARVEGLNARVAKARTALCLKAAEELQLKRRRRRGRREDGDERPASRDRPSSRERPAGDRATTSSDVYVGGIVVPNLGELHRYVHTALARSFDKTCQLVVLLATYLDVQLPYEILLPRRPAAAAPTALATASASISQSISSLSSFARGLTRAPPAEPESPRRRAAAHTSIRRRTRGSAARPLSLREPIRVLMQRDANVREVEAFLEAVALLAFDVAFLAATQGVPVDDAETALQLGDTLWRMLYEGRGVGSTEWMWPRAGADAAPRAVGVELRDIVDLLKERNMGADGTVVGTDWQIVEAEDEVDDETYNLITLSAET
ncbi:UV radiation resistance protein/autophagy-related protein 14 [Dipodascopsis tothii]|uniref:UV radiation resistance protein/autophagy-related protein 14 n=1 Tax=Dipodascopsis tothii TaxID=44089 RepID=UPI0034CE7FBC